MLTTANIDAMIRRRAHSLTDARTANETSFLLGVAEGILAEAAITQPGFEDFLYKATQTARQWPHINPSSYTEDG